MHATVFSTLISLIVFTILYLMLSRVSFSRKLTRGQRRIVVLLTFIFCLYPFYSGDYYHYAEVFSELLKGGSSGMEDIYTSIAQFSFNYLIFRLIVWGSAIALVLYLLKKVGADFDYNILFFISLYLLFFSYARVSLAMAMIFFGVYLLTSKIKVSRILLYTIGIGFILLSYFFHKSAVYGIGCVGFALLAYKMTKLRVAIILLMIPIVLVVLRSFIMNLLEQDAFNNESLINVYAAQRYITEGANQSEWNWGEGVQNILCRASFYIIGFIYLKTLLKGQYRSFPTIIKIYGTSAFICTLGANIFLLNIGFDTYTLYYRFLNFAMIPATIFIAYCYQYGCYRKIAIQCLFIGWLGSFYTLLYSIYCAYAGKI